MTTIYQDYYDAYDNKTMDISNVNFLALLIDDTYTPNTSDKLDDVTGMIIAVPEVITNNDMITLGMNRLMEKSTQIIKDYIDSYPEQITDNYKGAMNIFNQGKYIVMFNIELYILCFCEQIQEKC